MKKFISKREIENKENIVVDPIFMSFGANQQPARESLVPRVSKIQDLKRQSISLAAESKATSRSSASDDVTVLTQKFGEVSTLYKKNTETSQLNSMETSLISEHLQSYLYRGS